MGILKKNHNITAAYKRRKNLRDYLVKAKLPSLIKEKQEKEQNFLNPNRWVKNKSTGDKFYINEQTNLETKNCVYLTCAICEMKYVGETGNTLARRFYQYKYNIITLRVIILGLGRVG